MLDLVEFARAGLWTARTAEEEAVDEVERWLAPLGLAQVAPVLRANDVDLEILPELSEADLEKLGLSLGQRKKLMKAAASLSGASRSSAASVSASASDMGATAVSAERRLLTVMFCDLVGSTALAADLDPEDMRDLIATYQGCVAEVVTRFDGFIAKYMGDGVLVYFGYPQAHEDDAERAVRSGLALTVAVPSLSAPEPLSVRVGIATGLVVVGDLIGSGEAQERGVVGQTPNLAARLQALAEPNAVYIGQETRRQVGNLFDCADLRLIGVKGFPEPVRAWRVLNEGQIESRFDAFHGGPLTPLIGREDELDLILRCWRRARGGDGQVVLLSGEPGIGKSRIVATVQEALAADDLARLRYFSSPHHQNSALHSVVAQLERSAGFSREDDDATRLEKLGSALSRDIDPADFALVAELMSLPTEGLRVPLGLSPQRKKERILQALLRQLEVLARERPVLMIFEDVHWIDPSTRDLLDLLVERAIRLPILLLVSFRPEFQPPWTGQEQVTFVALNRLNRRECAEMVGRLAGGKPLPPDVLDQIVERTDGVPLFVEELTSSILESGLVREEQDQFVLTGAVPSLAIPTTLRGLLMARLDRLSPVREIAQIGAAIGREFSYDLVAAVADRSDATLSDALDQLVRAELVFCKGHPPDATYTFKHALVQDAAYDTLLKSRRHQLHARIANALQERFPEVAQGQPELLFHHFAQAGWTEQALEYGLRAGQLAVKRSALVEAIAHFRKALDLIKSPPAESQHHRYALELQIALAQVLLAKKGYAAPAVGEAFNRALELCEPVGTVEQRLAVLWGLHSFHFVRAEFRPSFNAGREAHRLGMRTNHAEASMFGHLSMGHNLVQLGRIVQARQHFEKALIHCELIADDSDSAGLMIDLRASLCVWSALDLLLLGYPDQARLRSSEAQARAQDPSRPQKLPHILGYTLRQNYVLRDYVAIRKQAEALAKLSEEYGYAYYKPVAAIWIGWLQAGEGRADGAVELLEQALRGYQSAGAMLTVPFTKIQLAEVHRTAGDPTRALDALNGALQVLEQTDWRWLEAEVHRLRAETLLSLGQNAEAQDCFERSLLVARKQGAKLWELRTSTSLARLWRDQGRFDQARDLLAPIYGWFTEGFDTTDLREARALLDALR